MKEIKDNTYYIIRFLRNVQKDKLLSSPDPPQNQISGCLGLGVAVESDGDVLKSDRGVLKDLSIHKIPGSAHLEWVDSVICMFYFKAVKKK